MKYQHEYGVELEEIIRKVARDGNKQFVREFLFDLLSPKEYRDLAVRWQIVKQLKAGIGHRDIAKNLKVSVGTTTRGSRELENKKGGFNLAYAKFYKK